MLREIISDEVLLVIPADLDVGVWLNTGILRASVIIFGCELKSVLDLSGSPHILPGTRTATSNANDDNFDRQCTQRTVDDNGLVFVTTHKEKTTTTSNVWMILPVVT